MTAPPHRLTPTEEYRSHPDSLVRGYGHLLDGQDTSLVPVAPEHYETLRTLEVVKLGAWWRNRGASQSPNEFAERIWNGTVSQFLGVGNSDGKLLLWLQCYNPSLVDEVANVAVARLADGPLSLRAAASIAAFFEYCFDALNFRKLYLEAAGPNLPLFSEAIGPLFIEEGRLRDYLKQGPDTYDLIILAVDRDLWNLSEIRKYLLSRHVRN